MIAREFFQERQVRHWMRRHAAEHIDARTGELNLTSLAESAAAAFGVNGEGGPLDDPDHWIWEIPVEISEELEEGAAA